ICNFVLGILHPPYVGTQFGMAEKNVIKAVAQLLNLSESTVQKAVKKEGDLGLVVEHYQWQGQSEDALTICHVYNLLCAIEELSGNGSQEPKITHLNQLLKQLDPLSTKYVLRIF